MEEEKKMGDTQLLQQIRAIRYYCDMIENYAITNLLINSEKYGEIEGFLQGAASSINSMDLGVAPAPCNQGGTCEPGYYCDMETGDCLPWKAG